MNGQRKPAMHGIAAGLHGAAASAKALLRWWLAELAGLLPHDLRVIARPGDRALILRVDAGGARLLRRAHDRLEDLGPADSAAPGLSKRLRRRPVAIWLAPEDVMQRDVELPLAAEENLSRVLGFEMDRLTPFKADEVRYDHRIRSRDSARGRLEVAFAAAPRRLVDDALAQAEALGLTPAGIDVAEADGTAGEGYDLLPRTADARRGGTTVWLNRALATLAACLIALVAWLPLEQQRSRVDELRRAVAEARSAALEIEQLRAELARQRDLGQGLHRLKAETPMLAGILLELTRLVPDDSWLQHLEVRGGEIRFSGFSPAASSLVRRLEDSALFEQARFTSAVLRDAKLDRERFELAAQIVTEGQR